MSREQREKNQERVALNQLAPPGHSKFQERADRFHAHLDDCQQCANHPFALCSVGAKLLQETAQ